MKYRAYLSYLFFIAIILNSFAQDNGNTIELKKILESISTQHNITFNYLEEDIIAFKTIPPNTALTLTEKLNYLANQTNLKFYFVTEHYISIVPNKEIKICGYLIDYETNETIENASIHYTQTNNFTISDHKGYFEITYSSSNPLEINHLGYKKLILQLKKEQVNDCNTYYLEPNSSQLKEVIAQVYLTKGISKKIDGSFEIQPKKFSILPGLTEPDVFQTMQQIPGINSPEETVSNINVRGGSHDQNLFLWNDIRLFQTGHFYGLISVLNPNLPNKIKITKNGTSALFGESVSSTVSIHTENTSPKNNNSFGLNLLNFDFNSDFKISPQSSLTISGRRSYTDLVRTTTYKNYYKRIFQNTVVSSTSNESIPFTTDENFYFYDATLQYDHKLSSKNSFQINLITISNQLDLQQSKIENNTTVQKNSSLEQQSFGGSAWFKRNWNAKHTTKMTVYASNYQINSKNESINGNQVFQQENTVLDTGIRIENQHEIKDAFTFREGYQFNEIGIRNKDAVTIPTFSRNIKNVLQHHAIIAEGDYISKNQKWNATLGLRYTYISTFQKSIVEPRIRFNYQVSETLSSQVLAEKKHQTSTQVIDLQQDFLGVENRRWVLVNNEDIPIITSNQVSWGFTFKKNNWLISMDNFYKKVDGITSRSQGFQNQLEFERISGKYTIIGSEILVQKQIQNFTTWLSYTISRNNYIFENFEPQKFPNNFDIQHNLELGLVYNADPFKIAFGSRWFSGRPTTLPLTDIIVDNDIVYNAPNSARLSDYFQTNLSAGYTYTFDNLNKLQMGASVQNVFNTKNNLNQYYRINQNTNSIEKVNTYSLALTSNAYIRYFF